jgi:hypothetical protein
MTSLAEVISANMLSLLFFGQNDFSC